LGGVGRGWERGESGGRKKRKKRKKEVELTQERGEGEDNIL
jgi:hypothetical protein